MGISERKERIVRAVVDNYINKCTPISSAEIRDEYLPALSSATIRNELAALEEMGYLRQPHTSSGRVPTVEAYKLYVDKLMPQQKLSDSDINIVKSYFGKKMTEIDELLKSAAKVISEITHLTGVSVKYSIEEAEIQNIKIVKISPKNALVIVVTNLDIFKDAVVDIANTVSEDYCDAASNLVTDAFAGHTIKEVLEPKAIIRKIKKEYEDIFSKVISALKSYTEKESADIAIEGGSKILEQPEFADVKKARAMMEVLEAKERLGIVLSSGGNITINTGGSAADDGRPEYAVVTADMSAGGVNIGKAGVIGPVRMDYSKIVSVLEYIGNIVNVFGIDGDEK